MLRPWAGAARVAPDASIVWLLQPQTGVQYARVSTDDPNFLCQFVSPQDADGRSTVFDRDLSWVGVSPSLSDVQTLYVDTRVAFVGNEQGQVYVFSNAFPPKLIAMTAPVQQSPVTAVLHTCSSSLYVATRDGSLRCYNTGSKLKRRTTRFGDASGRFSDESRDSALLDNGDEVQPVVLMQSSILLYPDTQHDVFGSSTEIRFPAPRETSATGPYVKSLVADSDCIYAGLNDGHIYVWRLHSQALLREILFHHCAVSSMLRSGPSALWVGYEDGLVQALSVVGDESTGIDVLAQRQPHSSAVTSILHVSADEIWSVAEGDKSSPAVWKVHAETPCVFQTPDRLQAAENLCDGNKSTPSRESLPSSSNQRHSPMSTGDSMLASRNDVYAELRPHSSHSEAFGSAQVLIELDRVPLEHVKFLALGTGERESRSSKILGVTALPRSPQRQSPTLAENDGLPHDVDDNIGIYAGDYSGDMESIEDGFDENDGENGRDCSEDGRGGLPASEKESRDASTLRALPQDGPTQSASADAVECSLVDTQSPGENDVGRSVERNTSEQIGSGKVTREIPGRTSLSDSQDACNNVADSRTSVCATVEEQELPVAVVSASESRQRTSAGGPDRSLQEPQSERYSKSGDSSVSSNTFEPTFPLLYHSRGNQALNDLDNWGSGDSPTRTSLTGGVRFPAVSYSSSHFLHTLVHDIYVVLQRALSQLPRTRKQRGPFAKELDAACDLLHLCATSIAQVRSEKPGSEMNTVAELIAVDNCDASVVQYIIDLKNKAAKAKQEASAAKNSYKNIRCQTDDISSKHKHLEKELIVSQETNKALENDLQELEAESSLTVLSLERKLIDQSNVAKSFQEQLRSVEGKYSAECAGRASLEIELDNKLDIIKSLQKAHRNAEHLVLDKTAEISSLEARLKILESKCSIEDQVDGHQDGMHVPELFSRVAKLTARLNAEEERSANYVAVIERLQDELKRKTASIPKLENALSKRTSRPGTEVEWGPDSTPAAVVDGSQQWAVGDRYKNDAYAMAQFAALFRSLWPNLADNFQSVCSRLNDETAQLAQDCDRLRLIAEADGRSHESGPLGSPTVLPADLIDLQTKEISATSRVSVLERNLAERDGKIRELNEENKLLREAEKLNLQQIALKTSIAEKQWTAIGLMEDQIQNAESILRGNLQQNDDSPNIMKSRDGSSSSCISISCRSQHSPALESECRKDDFETENNDDAQSTMNVESGDKSLRRELDSVYGTLDGQLTTIAVLACKLADKQELCDNLAKRLADLENSIPSPESRASQRPARDISKVTSDDAPCKCNRDGRTNDQQSISSFHIDRDTYLEMQSTGSKMKEIYEKLKLARQAVQQLMRIANAQFELLPSLRSCEESLRQDLSGDACIAPSADNLKAVLETICRVSSRIFKAHDALRSLGLDRGLLNTPESQQTKAVGDAVDSSFDRDPMLHVRYAQCGTSPFASRSGSPSDVNELDPRCTLEYQLKAI